MIIKQLLDEDFVNYKKASMFIGFPSCTFKCETDCNCPGICHNSDLAKPPYHDVSIEYLVDRYINNDITSAIVCGGLEPFDSFDDLYELIKYLRECRENNDDIVIYTGYNKSEILDKLIHIFNYKNIIIKYGRFIPNNESHFDEVLGIKLSSDNQYGEMLKPFKYTHKIIKNSKLSEEEINSLEISILDNDGYCPCRISKTDDNKCVCKDFKDSFKNKNICDCHCGLYSIIVMDCTI